jgi:hypothetical protein
VGYNQLTVNIGANPTNVGLFSYRPQRLAASPAGASRLYSSAPAAMAESHTQ